MKMSVLKLPIRVRCLEFLPAMAASADKAVLATIPSILLMQSARGMTNVGVSTAVTWKVSPMIRTHLVVNATYISVACSIRQGAIGMTILREDRRVKDT